MPRHRIGRNGSIAGTDSVLTLRPETPSDVDAIRALTSAAFSGAPHSDGSEPDIVDRLRADGDLSVSLVALANGVEDADDGAIVGHVALSPVRAGSAPGSWFGLGPISVAPALQGRGTGGALVEAALAQLRARGAAGCVLVGDPAYYSRFGFTSGRFCYQGLPAEYVQHLVLDGSAGDEDGAADATSTATPEQIEYARAFGPS